MMLPVPAAAQNSSVTSGARKLTAWGLARMTFSAIVTR